MVKLEIAGDVTAQEFFMLNWLNNLLASVKCNPKVTMLLVQLGGSHYQQMCFISV